MLRSEELDRIKYELGVSVTRIGAEPYLTYVAIFDRVVQPYLYDNSTTASTSVGPSGGPTPITVAANPIPPNGVGLTFTVGTSVLVDVGPAAEQVTVMAVAGLVLTVSPLVNSHTAPYPVAPVGSEQIVRGILTRIVNIQTQMDNIAPLTAGVEQVDEAKLVPNASGKRGRSEDKFASLVRQRDQARNDLADAIGFENLRAAKRSGATRMVNY